jgi:hypothetical protein
MAFVSENTPRWMPTSLTPSPIASSTNGAKVTNRDCCMLMMNPASTIDRISGSAMTCLNAWARFEPAVEPAGRTGAAGAAAGCRTNTGSKASSHSPAMTA